MAPGKLLVSRDEAGQTTWAHPGDTRPESGNDCTTFGAPSKDLLENILSLLTSERRVIHRNQRPEPLISAAYSGDLGAREQTCLQMCGGKRPERFRGNSNFLVLAQSDPGKYVADVARVEASLKELEIKTLSP
jgi:hypothetical protein